MGKLRDVTLVFLVKKSGDKITEICLAMKKRGFGVNRWNGVGGKLLADESIEMAAKREAQEEIGVDLKKINKIAEIDFYFPHQTDWNQTVNAFFCEEWEGEPIETEEMRPRWFNPSELPYESMWSDDKFWVPHILEGKLLKASFVFKEHDLVDSHNLEFVNKF
ncbi:MAG: 8-oxo-dGTP diphosphatase [Patescibacteria group bacterium]|nr:8-oxo-dGTP diphosphatase [Patescibacteria group bacterium]MDD5121005.1 8-oxo-dGTP diphosphatase [Patescibacteria group bacterium]MDD5221634.1 8-oxo-dGTP diphosphatase [Patescibacteria group bacterium]MDD5396076.1 8-oxo-dGTP diphosphatase [Patescibacteria group bacterium]